MPKCFRNLMPALLFLALTGPMPLWADSPDTPLPHLPQATALDLLAPALRAGLPGDWALEVGSFPTDATGPVLVDLSFTQTGWPQTFVTLYLTTRPQDLARLKPVFENPDLARAMGAEALMIAGHDCQEMAQQHMITCRVGGGLVQFGASTIGDGTLPDQTILRAVFEQSPFALYNQLFSNGEAR
jgi:hypothetical protein